MMSDGEETGVTPLMGLMMWLIGNTTYGVNDVADGVETGTAPLMGLITWCLIGRHDAEAWLWCAAVWNCPFLQTARSQESGGTHLNDCAPKGEGALVPLGGGGGL